MLQVFNTQVKLSLIWLLRLTVWVIFGSVVAMIIRVYSELLTWRTWNMRWKEVTQQTCDGRKSHNKMIISYNFNIFQHFEIENTYSNLASLIAIIKFHTDNQLTVAHNNFTTFIGCVWTKTRWLSQICFYFPPYSAEWSNHLRRNVVNCFNCNVGGAPWRNDDALDNCSASGLGFMGGSLGVDVYGVRG